MYVSIFIPYGWLVAFIVCMRQMSLVIICSPAFFDRYDTTPSDYISMIITDYGMVSSLPSEVVLGVLCLIIL